MPGWYPGAQLLDASWHFACPWPSGAEFTTALISVKLPAANALQVAIRCFENISDNPASATKKWEIRFSGAATPNKTGTISSSGTAVTGSSTLFTTEYAVGDIIKATSGAQSGVGRVITAIATNTSLTVQHAWPADIVAGASHAEHFEAVALAASTYGVSHTIIGHPRVNQGDIVVLDVNLDSSGAIAARDLLVELVGTTL